jgi:hypothetical protein
VSEAISAGSENGDTKFPDVAFAHPGYGDDETLRQTAAFTSGFITKN